MIAPRRFAARRHRLGLITPSEQSERFLAGSARGRRGCAPLDPLRRVGATTRSRARCPTSTGAHSMENAVTGWTASRSSRSPLRGWLATRDSDRHGSGGVRRRTPRWRSLGLGACPAPKRTTPTFSRRARARPPTGARSWRSGRVQRGDRDRLPRTRARQLQLLRLGRHPIGEGLRLIRDGLADVVSREAWKRRSPPSPPAFTVTAPGHVQPGPAEASRPSTPARRLLMRRSRDPRPRGEGHAERGALASTPSWRASAPRTTRTT